MASIEEKLDNLGYPKEKIEEIVTIDLINLLKQKKPLSLEYIEKVILFIAEYYNYFKDSKNKKEDFFDRFFDIYDSYIPNKYKLDVLLKINKKESFNNYARKNYSLLKKEFEKHLLIPKSYANDFDSLEDFQFEIDILYPNDNYKAI